MYNSGRILPQSRSEEAEEASSSKTHQTHIDEQCDQSGKRTTWFETRTCILQTAVLLRRFPC